MPQSTGNSRPPDGHGQNALDDQLTGTPKLAKPSSRHPQAPASLGNDDVTFVGGSDATILPCDGTALSGPEKTMQGAAAPTGRVDPDATMMPVPNVATRPQDPDATIMPVANAPTQRMDADATMLPTASAPPQRLDPDATMMPVAGASGRKPDTFDDITRFAPLPTATRRPPTERRPAPATPAMPAISAAAASASATDVSGDQGPLAVGQPFGPRYHIMRVLGVGGMGAVYQAWDAELGVPVAVKVIRPEIAADPVAAAEIERRFKRELLLARQVTHPNIIRIHDLGDIDGIKYITMPFIDGSDLATILKEEKKLRIPRALRIARGTVSGLVSAHKAGVIHRDLKPANIMIGVDDAPTIMDFGIARSAGGPGDGPAPSSLGIQPANLSHTAALSASSTMAGAIVGTVAYMAPEQARGEAVDQRADIYAFGLILYDMLIGGRRSERAASAIAELQQRMQTPPPAPRSIDPAIPEAVDEIIRRCLEPDLTKRFPTTVDLQNALNRLDENGQPLPIIRRVSLKTLIASVAVMLVALAGAWYYALQLVVPVEHGPVSLIIADFQNQTKDSDFDGSLELALSVGIEGASFITPFDRYEARRIAERMTRGRTLSEDNTRAVAEREGIKVVLAGSIAPDDDGYTIAVRGIDASNGKELWTERASADTKQDVLSAVGEVAADVKEQLGDDASKTERLAPGKVVASRSIVSLRAYSLAQDLFLSNQPADAIAYYERAVKADPNFGRAYANWGLAAYTLGRKDEAEALWKTALSLVDRMTEQEKYNTLSTYYATIVGNYEKAIEYYEMLSKLSPFDARVHNNLAIAYFRTRNFAKATEEASKAVEIYKGNVNRRVNLALYAMYAGDFETAVKQAEEINKEAPGRHQTYLPIAMSAIVKNDFDAARKAYELMKQTGAQGASLAATGLADLAIYRGEYAEAEAILTAAIAEDRAAKHTAGLTAKFIALAETYEATGRMPLAISTAKEATSMSTEEAALVPTALLLLRARQSADAETIAADLDNMLQTQKRAYAKVIDGKVALLRRRRATAIDAFREAVKFGDPWLTRFEMGIAYVEAGHFAEGFAELDMCLKRRGEVTAMFLDDSPTIRYLSTLPYWLGRAQEGLGQKDAATASFTAFVSTRSAATDDPLVVDARKRIAQ